MKKKKNKDYWFLLDMVFTILVSMLVGIGYLTITLQSLRFGNALILSYCLSTMCGIVLILSFIKNSEKNEKQ